MHVHAYIYTVYIIDLTIILACCRKFSEIIKAAKCILVSKLCLNEDFTSFLPFAMKFAFITVIPDLIDAFRYTQCCAVLGGNKELLIGTVSPFKPFKNLFLLHKH